MIITIAVDDEPVALDIIKNHCEKIQFVQLAATFLSAADAFQYMKSNTVDLVFMDISMPGLSGLELAEMVKNMAQIVFVTAHPEHAIKGFELAATDYLLKPINYDRFLKACQLAETRKFAGDLRPAKDEILFVKDGFNWVSVKLDELLYIRGEDNYANLFMRERSILTRMTLTELQKRLPVGQFLRVHKSFIVALSKIDKIEKHQIIIKGTKIPLSMISADTLLKKLSA
ncbi:LytR/AlgR family response regulator transcription factor [Sediminibacterium ginsengisoli]|uniref:DNA-binding response regulator, LytR/AlgR family n=1 Tax=Sediminibacterium ginsengisoli TaxID=413434 RepID=A0A1T4M9I1_9BACT|nr:LytTR family DNA-binding domain-containing protein [Sediminibacterium ginsengisoli]SJZ63497.1 DNA-binding response regulator, LytR/AlgR family [Sediminibacterium ginsengisoli]